VVVEAVQRALEVQPQIAGDLEVREAQERGLLLAGGVQQKLPNEALPEAEMEA
jgi:hypothetical protein